MNTENPPAPPLNSREVMLETLHMAYQFVLDQSDRMYGRPYIRLDEKDEHELGRRLTQYWGMKAGYEDAVATALGMVADSDARMNTYTPAQRAALEAEGRALALSNSLNVEDPFLP